MQNKNKKSKVTTLTELKKAFEGNKYINFDDTSVKDKTFIWVLDYWGKLVFSFVVNNKTNKATCIKTNKKLSINDCYEVLKRII